MAETTNLHLKKPEYADPADIKDINDNMDTLDTVIKQAQDNIDAIEDRLPEDDGDQYDVLRSNGDGTSEWVAYGLPTDEQTASAVSDWLDDHPEATTTVQDGAITRAKLDADLKEKTDAVHDLKSAINANSYATGMELFYGYINTSGAHKADANGNRKHTGFFFVYPGTTIEYIGENNHSSINGISFYTVNKEYISGDSNSGTLGQYSTVTVPDNAVFAIISTKNDINWKAEIKKSGNASYSSLIPEYLINKFKADENVVNTDVLHFGYTSDNAITLTENTNIDNLSSGNYVCLSGTVSATLTGLPVGMSKSTFRLVIFATPSDVKMMVLIPRYRSEIFIKKAGYTWFKIGNESEFAYISDSTGSDTYQGNSVYPFKTIGYALSNGYRKLKVEPGVYNEKISYEGGDLEIIPWVDGQSYSATNAPFRPKIKIIKGTKLTVSSTGTTGIYQASYTAESGTNIYKVFVDHSVNPTTSGSLALEYNALLVGDMPNTSTSSKAFSPYRQQFYTPVLTETELSAEGTFWYDGTNHLIKFHAWNDTADGEYYIPDDDADTGISLSKMDSVHLEDVKVLGFYDNCIKLNKCDNVVINACEVGYCAKGMGIGLDYTNASVSDCHAYAISADGFNLHGYGFSEIVNCTAFYCGDDGISHHEGCSGFIEGGEWAYNHSGGITPAFGSQIDVRNVNAHHNGVGINYLGLDTQSRHAKMTNCLAVDNTTDVYVKWYYVEAWNNVFRTKDVPYHSDRSNLIEYGTVTPT